MVAPTEFTAALEEPALDYQGRKKRMRDIVEKMMAVSTIKGP